MKMTSRFSKSSILVKFTTLPLVRGLFNVQPGAWDAAVKKYMDYYFPSYVIEKGVKGWQLVVEVDLPTDPVEEDELPDLETGPSVNEQVQEARLRALINNPDTRGQIMDSIQSEMPEVDLLLLFGYLSRRTWPYTELKTIAKLMEYLPVKVDD